MRNMKRAAALGAALVLCVSCFAGCGSKDSSGNTSNPTSRTAMEDLDYGATLRIDKKAYGVPMQYDKRFFEDEASLQVIGNYYRSIAENDSALFEQVQLPAYLDYTIKTVHKSEFTTAELVQATHDSWKEHMDGDFAISLVDIVGCEVSRTYTGITTILDMLDSIQEGISGKIDVIYELTVDVYLTPADSGIVGLETSFSSPPRPRTNPRTKAVFPAPRPPWSSSTSPSFRYGLSAAAASSVCAVECVVTAVIYSSTFFAPTGRMPSTVHAPLPNTASIC